ncbi:MAG: HD domain-containing protein [Candidatus Omnitrophica bacterium]|nr:HD domain-containing protein [Candidatus Omnitrophota bacterium]
MTFADNGEKDRLFQKLSDSDDLKKEIAAFGRYLRIAECEILPDIPKGYSGLKGTRLHSSLKKSLKEQKKSNRALKTVLKAMKGAARTGDLLDFTCADKFRGFCYPLAADEEIFGYIVGIGLKKAMSPGLRRIFTSFTEAVIRESRKEIDLEEVNKTIRPRAIALSTVHTVHRLMSSTLDLGELLKRIARLSLQVMRANRCSIKLLDKKKKVLLPKATVDLRKKKTKLKKVQIGKYAPGRAVKKCMSIRKSNYLATPLIDEDVIGVITLYDKLDGKEFTAFDEEIMKTLAEQAAIAIRNAQLFREQEDLTLSSIKCIAQLLEARSYGIQKAEGSFLKLIARVGRRFEMNESEIKMLQYAAMLHDAGQLSIPEKVLLKRGELTCKELDIIKKHPSRGANILSKFKPLKPIVPIILYHHENYDGSGYPKGLKGDNIPIAARILAVVSSFEAMITDKPYRRALSISAAIKEVKKNSGTQFDPEVVKAFVTAVNRKNIRKILHRELGER